MESTTDHVKEYLERPSNSSKSIESPSARNSSSKSPSDSYKVTSEDKGSSSPRTSSDKSKEREEGKRLEELKDSSTHNSPSERSSIQEPGDSVSKLSSREKFNENQQEVASISNGSFVQLEKEMSKESTIVDYSELFTLHDSQNGPQSSEWKIDLLSQISLNPLKNRVAIHILCNSETRNDQKIIEDLIKRSQCEEESRYNHVKNVEIPIYVASNDMGVQEYFDIQDDYIYCDGEWAAKCLNTHVIDESEIIEFSNRRQLRIRISDINVIVLPIEYKHDVQGWQEIFNRLRERSIKMMILPSLFANIDEILSSIEFKIETLMVFWEDTCRNRSWIHYLKYPAQKCDFLSFRNCHFFPLDIEVLLTITDNVKLIGFENCAFYCDISAEEELDSCSKFIEHTFETRLEIRFVDCRFGLTNHDPSISSKQNKLANEHEIWPAVCSIFRPFLDYSDQIIDEDNPIFDFLTSKRYVVFAFESLSIVYAIRCMEWVYTLNPNNAVFLMYNMKVVEPQDEAAVIMAFASLGILNLQVIEIIVSQMERYNVMPIYDMIPLILDVLKDYPCREDDSNDPNSKVLCEHELKLKLNLMCELEKLIPTMKCRVKLILFDTNLKAIDPRVSSDSRSQSEN